MTNVELKNNLIAVLGAGNVLTDEPMMRHCSFRVGGPADFFLQVDRLGQLAPLLAVLKTAGEPYFILGRGTNLLTGDKGYRGAVITFTAAGAVPLTDTRQEESASVAVTGVTADEIKLQDRNQTQGENSEGKENPWADKEDVHFRDLRVDHDRIIAGAGVSLSGAARAALEHGLSGLEFAAGIPGSVGGGLVMNAGAYGGEMKDVVESAVLLMTEERSASYDAGIPAAENASNDAGIPAARDASYNTRMSADSNEYFAQNGQGSSGGKGIGIRKLTNEDLHFGYRHSVLKETSAIVLQATFHLHEDDPSHIRARMMDFASRRIEKQPLEYPSAGSTFKRPEGHFAGKLIQDAGLRGYRVGGACVSEKHCGFVINQDHATAGDIRQVIRDVQARVYEDSGVWLEPEVIFLGDF